MINAAFLRKAAAMGLSIDQAAELAETIEAGMELPVPDYDSAASRKRARDAARMREKREAERVSRDVVGDVAGDSLSQGSLSPEPPITPNPIPLPPIVPQKRGRKRPVRRAYSEDFEACWATYPHHEGRSSKPNSADEYDRLPDDEQSRLLGAIGRFAPRVAEVYGGKGAPDMARWLADGKHLSWLEAAPAASMRPKFPNAAIRTYIAEHKSEAWAVSYLDTCAYAEVAGIKTITAPNDYIAAKLRTDVPALEQRGVLIAVQSSTNPQRSAA